MRKNFNFVFALLFIASIFSSCTKKTDPTPVPLTSEQQIIGKYKLTAKTKIVNGTVTDILRPCDLDDIFDIQASGVLILNNGTVRCTTTSTTPQTETLTYSYSPSLATLDLGGNLLTNVSLNAITIVGTSLSPITFTFTRI